MASSALWLQEASLIAQHGAALDQALREAAQAPLATPLRADAVRGACQALTAALRQALDTAQAQQGAAASSLATKEAEHKALERRVQQVRCYALRIRVVSVFRQAARGSAHKSTMEIQPAWIHSRRLAPATSPGTQPHARAQRHRLLRMQGTAEADALAHSVAATLAAPQQWVLDDEADDADEAIKRRLRDSATPLADKQALLHVRAEDCQLLGVTGASVTCAAACTRSQRVCVQGAITKSREALVEAREQSKAQARYGRLWVAHARKENRCKICERPFALAEEQTAFCERHEKSQCGPPFPP